MTRRELIRTALELYSGTLAVLVIWALLAAALWLAPLPDPEPPTPGGRWVPVHRMPACDRRPEPPLKVERRTTWCPRPR